VIGNLTYEYDNAGNRTKTGGTWARTGVPQNVPSTSYDANNRQLTFGDKTLSYDDNGNLQEKGSDFDFHTFFADCHDIKV